jgi:hypothetical protein
MSEGKIVERCNMKSTYSLQISIMHNGLQNLIPLSIFTSLRNFNISSHLAKFLRPSCLPR